MKKVFYFICFFMMIIYPVHLFAGSNSSGKSLTDIAFERYMERGLDDEEIERRRIEYYDTMESERERKHSEYWERRRLSHEQTVLEWAELSQIVHGMGIIGGPIMVGIDLWAGGPSWFSLAGAASVAAGIAGARKCQKAFNQFHSKVTEFNARAKTYKFSY